MKLLNRSSKTKGLWDLKKQKFLRFGRKKKKQLKISISVDSLDPQKSGIFGATESKTAPTRRYDEDSDGDDGLCEQEISRIMDDMWQRYPRAVVETKRQLDNHGQVVFEVN
ncbi:MAG: hypothetical protein KKF56_02945 [Nanoarchaeota archaeon]|nr:hypothetical protein [Nanoarchaeota archaeon]